MYVFLCVYYLYYIIIVLRVCIVIFERFYSALVFVLDGSVRDNKRSRWWWWWWIKMNLLVQLLIDLSLKPFFFILVVVVVASNPNRRIYKCIMNNSFYFSFCILEYTNLSFLLSFFFSSFVSVLILISVYKLLFDLFTITPWTFLSQQLS